MATALCIALSLGLVAANIDVDLQTVQYGKYYSLDGWGAKSSVDNSYYLFRPKGYDVSVNGKLPVVVQFHGGGFTGGRPYTRPTAEIQAAVNNGIAYISVGYRLVATKYYYGDGTPEELIHVDKDGRLTLDTSGKTMDDYRVRRGRQEFQTKCSYDTAQMIEHLIAHADDHGVDVHRISTTGGSAGGGEIHYLTWVYHRWNVGRYTPRGMVYTMAQLDYPVQNMLDRAWGLWADDVGADTKLSAILQESDCGMIVGNPWCSQPADYNLCNATYNAYATGRFCGGGFRTATLGELRDALVWPSGDPEVGKGMEVLWYNSLNMLRHQPRPFYLYVANRLDGIEGMNVVHSALYSRNYAKFAEQAGINYTVYYTDYHGMTVDDRGQERLEEGGAVWNYRSSHGWRDAAGVREAGLASPGEQLLFHCLALGVRCSGSPGPSPGPSPSPPSPLSSACRRAIDAACPVGARCVDCIPRHARSLISAGCPPARRGGARECIEYCRSRVGEVLV